MPNGDIDARVRGTLESSVNQHLLVGAVTLVAHNGEIVSQQAVGYRDREASVEMTVDSIFRFSSLTKSIVSAAAMALVERDILQLEAPAQQWVPEFAPRVRTGREPAITIRQLLTHTAGLTYGFWEGPDGDYHSAGVSEGFDDIRISGEDQLRRISSVPLNYAPGEGWRYSLSVDVLGEVLARAYGATLDVVISDLITKPLGIGDTAFSVTDLERLVVPYADGSPPRRMRDPDLVPMQGDSRTVFRFSPSRIFDNEAFKSGGSGMAGTASDFLAFLEVLRTGGSPILRPYTVESMMANQIGDLRIDVEPTPSWGFGFGGAVLIDPEMAQTPQGRGTFKWGGIYGNHWYIDRANSLSVVTLTNTAVEGFAGQTVTNLRKAIYGSTDLELSNGHNLPRH